MSTPKVSMIAAITMVAALPVALATMDAHAAGKEVPGSLRAVMEQLGDDMQAVTGAISNEDWALVARLAPGIAHHPEPPMMQKVRILKWLGTDAGTFRGFDGRVEEAANAMGEAAERGDGTQVIRAFADLQQACLACHQKYRAPFVEHFGEQR
ncbi:MAG: cytochrome c [Gammaproteobacteria bacterium]|jgi:cytochrome c556|nr:cytochrome c [Gammaproteobacteria bacterium]